MERSLAWLARHRWITVPYERLAERYGALVTLARALICWRRLRRAPTQE